MRGQYRNAAERECLDSGTSEVHLLDCVHADLWIPEDRDRHLQWPDCDQRDLFCAGEGESTPGAACTAEGGGTSDYVSNGEYRRRALLAGPAFVSSVRVRHFCEFLGQLA